MKRLTTDTPDGNFETMLNFVFSQDGWAHIRTDGEEGPVPLTQWAKAQCILHGCDEFTADTPQEIDEEICDCLTMDFPDCPVALAYCFAVQAVHLRDRLKMYEDILFAGDGTGRYTLNELKELVLVAESTCWHGDSEEEPETQPLAWQDWLRTRFERGGRED